MGGGTGSYTVLQGLKHYTDHLTAVVSVADDGGSSGRLRDEFGHLPPGDLRKCLVALSPSDEIGQVLRHLLDFRFSRGNGLDGHNFGNLMLTALTEITGNSVDAIQQASTLLNIQGVVLPVTLEDTRLVAELQDSTVIRGETHIDRRKGSSSALIQRIYLDPEPTVDDRVRQAIIDAEIIVIGPGDLYTSVLPNLLVRGVPEAIRESQAVVVYACNLMTKSGETNGFKASDFVREVHSYLGPGNTIDYVLANDRSFPQEVIDRYAVEHSLSVEIDIDRCYGYADKVICAPLAAAGELVRHDPNLLAQAILSIAQAQNLSQASPPTPSRPRRNLA